MDHRRMLLCTCLAGVLGLSACQTQPGAAGDGAPSSALEDLADPPAETDEPGGPSLAEMMRQSADDLNEILAMQGEAGEERSDGPASSGERRPWQDRMDEQGDPEPAIEVRAEPLKSTGPESIEVEALDAPPPDPIELVLEHLESLSANPERAFAAELLADAVREFADRSDDGRPGQRLSPMERDLVETLAPLLRAIAAGDRVDAPRRIAEAIEDVGRALPDVLPIRINDAALATDIYGFAAYRPFERYTFLAGRSNRMLLYTEPASFRTSLAAEPASRGEASNPGAYEVVLGLELRLFNERGSMLAWRKPEERIVIRSDRPRSEIYLGTVIDLPASLSVGRYQLKVIVRDKADDSEDERVIPIEIVADPRLTSRATRDR
ncbi:MAG: hypothetical protein RIE77_05685 [Phycisphaerales bacterium]